VTSGVAQPQHEPAGQQRGERPLAEFARLRPSEAAAAGPALATLTPRETDVLKL
jgi:hypothetical protein